MNSYKILLAAVFVVLTFATPSVARTYWDNLNDAAPLQPVFETLNDTAP